MIGAESYFEDMKVQVENSYAQIHMALNDFGKNITTEHWKTNYAIQTIHNLECMQMHC